jgi:hypothetical protein
MVTPTYYVCFTSATIVSSAILFRGFKGTAISITTVVMGFLVICVGVILLQLAKSSKDVPDTAVFKGEYDDVRTIAEQKEPEYEPRADTIRGGAAIVRALSRTRTKRQAEEVHRIHEERMQPIGENETVEWDGLKRRKTTSTAPGSIKRSNTVHPPLGMTHVPDDDSEPDEEMHPGFFGRLGRKMTNAAGHRKRSDTSPMPMASVNIHPKRTADYGDDDTSYHSPDQPHLRWAGASPEPDATRNPSQSSSLAPAPPPPPHFSPPIGQEAKRQFSFHNVFNRSRPGTGAGEDDNRPTSRGALSFASGSRRAHVTTEEERLGLVHGDSSNNMNMNMSSTSRYAEVPEGRESDEWQVTSGASSSSPEMLGASGDLGYAGAASRGKRDPYDDDYDDDDKLYDMPLRDPRESYGGGGRGSGGGSAFV